MKEKSGRVLENEEGDRERQRESERKEGDRKKDTERLNQRKLDVLRGKVRQRERAN